MYVRPLTLLKTLPQSELLIFECSDRVILPKSVCDAFVLRDVVFIKNASDQQVSGTIYDFHEEDEIIYMPSWMYWKYDFCGVVRIEKGDKKAWNSVQVRPHTRRFHDHTDFLELLNKAVARYGALTKNSQIPLLVNGEIEMLSIEGAFPSSVQTCAIEKCPQLSIQIHPSIEAMPKAKELSFLYSAPCDAPWPYAFLGKGYTLGGSPPSTNPAADAANAARRRAGKK